MIYQKVQISILQTKEQERQSVLNPLVNFLMILQQAKYLFQEIIILTQMQDRQYL